jgi:four helix bundle protein
MNRDELRNRMKHFSLRIIQLVGRLPNNRLGDVLGKQILRSGTSIGANYCEAMRASSKRHFISIVEIAAREAAETQYWLELLAESDIFKPSLLSPLMQECNELAAILTATGRTAKRNQKASPIQHSPSAIQNQHSG